MMAYLGIDTSNYRTSICIIDEHRKVLEELNPLLPVEEGELGLQQSKAVFEHLKSWMTILEQLQGQHQLKAIGVSTIPRPQEGSYMPVFKVGEVLAKTLAHFLSIPCFTFSHQEGHIAAGEYSINEQLDTETFIVVHLSGGTSEILLCSKKVNGYVIDKIGGTLDLHAGQFVDRVGVALKLPFPAGPYLERLAQQVDLSQTDESEHRGGTLPTIPSSVAGAQFSLSGPCTAALRLVEQRLEPAFIARAVEQCIANTLEKALRHSMSQHQIKHVLIVGGVAANAYIRKRLLYRLEHPAVGAKLFFAEPKYSTDNAFGTAVLAQKSLIE